MSFIIILLLGVIQGLTEFLPISSSGHLVVLYNIFGIENDTVFLSILLHLATLLAVVIFYRKEIICLIKKPFCKTNIKIFITTIITCLVVLVLKPFVYDSFGGKYIFVFFIITAFMLFISDYLTYKYKLLTKTKKLKVSNGFNNSLSLDITNLNISYFQAVIIGLTQGVACIPGISRSGSTIALSKICGVNPHDSATYSFLISIPIIIASLCMELIGGVSFKGFDFSLILSMVVCFVVGLLCIKLMIKIVNKNNLSVFGYYLLILSAFLIFNNMFLHWF